MLSLDVFVEPAEEFAVPYERVLGLENLMVFVFERYEAGRYALYPALSLIHI